MTALSEREWKLYQRQWPEMDALCVWLDESTGERRVCTLRELPQEMRGAYLVWKLSGIAREEMENGATNAVSIG